MQNIEVLGKDKNNILVCIDRVLNLYQIYENYAWLRENISIVISCENNVFLIKILSKDVEVDYLKITFDKKEQSTYEYFCSFLMFKIFENVVVHYDKENNTFYNKTHKNYLSLIVGDESLLDMCIYIMDMINAYMDSEAYKMLDDNYFSLKKRRRKINSRVIYDVEDKIGITKQMMKSGAYE